MHSEKYLGVCVVMCSQRQELESDNKKLKKDLQELRLSLSKRSGSKVASPGGQAYNVLLEQLNSSTEELEMRKEEVLILRSQLVNHEPFKHKVVCKVFSDIPHVKILSFRSHYFEFIYMYISFSGTRNWRRFRWLEQVQHLFYFWNLFLQSSYTWSRCNVHTSL